MSKNRPLFTSYSGPTLLETPLLNKGTAFSKEERMAFNLIGLLPSRYETIEEQLERAYHQYSSCDTPINKHIFLRSIQDNNETLFYRLVKEHLKEMMPIIYTPTVGDACEHFSDIYQSARGIFISYGDKGHLYDVFPKSKLYISALLPAMIGFFVGILVSLMGIGGGFLMVPAMIYLLGMPVHMVPGTSLFQITFVTAMVTMLQSVHNQTVDMMLAAVLILGSVVGAQLGLKIAPRLRGEWLRFILALIVLGVCGQMLTGLLLKPTSLFAVVPAR